MGVEAFCRVFLLGPVNVFLLIEPSASVWRSVFLSIVVAAVLSPDCRSLKTSSPEYEFVRLCDMAISRARSIASSQSSAAAEVADPSEELDLGSSKV